MHALFAILNGKEVHISIRQKNSVVKKKQHAALFNQVNQVIKIRGEGVCFYTGLNTTASFLNAFKTVPLNLF